MNHMRHIENECDVSYEKINQVVSFDLWHQASIEIRDVISDLSTEDDVWDKIDAVMPPDVGYP